MSPRRSAGCGPGASMSRAESSRRRESRTPRKSPPSLQRSGMRMYDLPDARGHFGPYGGVFVAETLTHALDELRDAYESARADAAFQAEFHHELKHYVGRPSPIYHARRLSERCDGAQIYIKREDLNHTGAHKINNTIGQALLARRMGKPRVIAETGAGMHGVAAATVAARYGMECIPQMQELAGRQPDAVIACVGGGSNAMGIFYPYIKHLKVRLIGVEAAGEGLASGRHAASLCAGKPGVLHGNRTYLLQDANGQITETHSISAGLDYPGVGPEHAWLKDSRRAEYVAVTDDEALSAFHELCRCEGIIPALESAHALAHAAKLARSLPKEAILLVNLSGRGDKDMHTIAQRSGLQF